MLIIKLKADNIRQLERAATEPELRGAVNMVLELMEQSKVLKSFGKTPKAEDKFTWKEARDILKARLGDDFVMPPFPDSQYFRNLSSAIKAWGMDEEYVKKLADKVVTDLRPPYNFSFLMAQAHRILGGAYDRQQGNLVRMGRAKAGEVPLWRNNSLPKE